MQKIKKALVKNFDDFSKSDFEKDLKMEEVPGFDSLKAVDFLLELEEEFDVDLSNSFVLETKTVREIHDEIKQQQSNSD